MILQERQLSSESESDSASQTALYIISIIYGIISVLFFIPGVLTHLRCIMNKEYSSFLKVLHALKLQLGIFCLIHGITFFFNHKKDYLDNLDKIKDWQQIFGCKLQAGIHICSLALILSFITSTILLILILLSTDVDLDNIKKKINLTGIIISIINWVLFFLFLILLVKFNEPLINAHLCRFSVKSLISIIFSSYTLLILILSLVLFFILRCKIKKYADKNENIVSYKLVLRNWLICEILIIIKFIFFFIHAVGGLIFVDRGVEIFTIFFINLVYVLGKKAFVELCEMISRKNNKTEDMELLSENVYI